MLAGIVGDLWNHMTAPVFSRLGAHSGLRDTDTITVSEHMRIIEAVAAKDAEGARGAMAVHLERVRKVLLEGAETAPGRRVRRRSREESGGHGGKWKIPISNAGRMT